MRKEEWFMKTRLTVFQLFLSCSFVMAQPGAGFYPHHVGDVWQYRSLFTNEIIETDYIDSVRLDTVSHDRFIDRRIRSSSGTNLRRERLDTLGNLYLVDYQPEYPRYMLHADTGTSWFAGYGLDSNLSYRISVIWIYQSAVFGMPTVVKVFRFEQRYAISGDTITITLGNEHLASGFGIVRMDVEPSDVYYLAGATIDSVQYGVIVSASEESSFLESPEVLDNYPNPFNTSTVISFTVSSEGHVNIRVYDMLGRCVETLIDERKEKGRHKLNFRAGGLASGVYLTVLQTETNKLTRKLLLIK